MDSSCLSIIKYTADDFNSLKKCGDLKYYVNVLSVCSEKSRQEKRSETNLEHLPIEILYYISELANDYIDIFYIKYSNSGKLKFPVKNGFDNYALRKCKVHSLKAKSSLYAVGQITYTPPSKVQGIRFSRNKYLEKF